MMQTDTTVLSTTKMHQSEVDWDQLLEDIASLLSYPYNMGSLSKKHNISRWGLYKGLESKLGIGVEEIKEKFADKSYDEIVKGIKDIRKKHLESA